jgi:hypothetical protein
VNPAYGDATVPKYWGPGHVDHPASGCHRKLWCEAARGADA